MLYTELGVRIVPAVERVPADLANPQLLGLPFVARPNMSVKFWDLVALDLEIDPPERRVMPPADDFDRLAKPLHAVQEKRPLVTGKISEASDFALAGEKETVAGQELGTAQHRTAPKENSQKCWVLGVVCHSWEISAT